MGCGGAGPRTGAWLRVHGMHVWARYGRDGSSVLCVGVWGGGGVVAGVGCCFFEAHEGPNEHEE